MSTHGISAITPEKRLMINRITGALCGMMSLQNKTHRVLMQDVMAGDACMDANSTANIMVRHSDFLASKGKSVDCFLSDIDAGHVMNLRRLADATSNGAAKKHVSQMDYIDAINASADFASYDGGNLLIDPYGTLDNLDKLADAIGRHPRVDVLFSLGACGFKRTNQKHSRGIRTFDVRAAIGKRHWLITKPLHRWQWIIMLGTNTDRIRDIESIGFCRIDSEMGAQQCRIIDYTKPELEAMGIKPTKNTCVTRRFYQQLPLLGLDRVEFASRAASGR